MFLSAQLLDLFAWCVRLSRLWVGFWTHFKSLHFSFSFHFHFCDAAWDQRTGGFTAKSVRLVCRTGTHLTLLNTFIRKAGWTLAINSWWWQHSNKHVLCILRPSVWRCSRLCCRTSRVWYGTQWLLVAVLIYSSTHATAIQWRKRTQERCTAFASRRWGLTKIMNSPRNHGSFEFWRFACFAVILSKCVNFLWKTAKYHALELKSRPHWSLFGASIFSSVWNSAGDRRGKEQKRM